MVCSTSQAFFVDCLTLVCLVIVSFRLPIKFFLCRGFCHLFKQLSPCHSRTIASKVKRVRTAHGAREELCPGGIFAAACLFCCYIRLLGKRQLHFSHHRVGPLFPIGVGVNCIKPLSSAVLDWDGSKIFLIKAMLLTTLPIAGCVIAFDSVEKRSVCLVQKYPLVVDYFILWINL